MLNSTATLFSLGVFARLGSKDEKKIIAAGKICGGIVAIFAMTTAPLLAGQESIFDYLQKMNGLYFIPIFSVMLMGMFTKKVPAFAANMALVLGFVVIALGYFVPALEKIVDKIHEFHFLGAVFVGLILLMAICRTVAPLKTPWRHEYSGEVDLTPWKWAKPLGISLAAAVLFLYLAFADLSVL